MCTLAVKKSATRQWATLDETVVLGEADIRNRVYHGIRVRCLLSGRFSFTDLNWFFLQFTASLVFLSLPSRFMFFFITYMLGHLSAIYTDVLIERFNVGMEIARVCARLMSNSVTFERLADSAGRREAFSEHRQGGDLSSSKPEHSVGCISKSCVEEKLQMVLVDRRGELDSDELQMLIDFCHNSLLQGGRMARRPGLLEEIQKCPKKVRKFIAARREGAAVTYKEKGLTIDDFSMCCAGSPSFEFETFVTLFDADRPVTSLERFFTPFYLEPVYEQMRTSRRSQTSKRVSAAPEPPDIGTRPLHVEGQMLSDGPTAISETGNNEAKLRPDFRLHVTEVEDSCDGDGALDPIGGSRPAAGTARSGANAAAQDI